MTEITLPPPAKNYEKAVRVWPHNIRTYGQEHGGSLRDILVAQYPGNGVAVDSADGILRELTEAGIVYPHDKPAMTHSQSAFLGLYRKSHPGWVAGCREHVYYFIGKMP